MKHFTTSEFCKCFEKLPDKVQKLANKNYSLLKENPDHPSLHYKKIGRYRSVRIGLKYRALGVEVPDGILWFWIGTHAEYDKLVEN